MKTLLQALFFFLLVTQICFAQWYQQYSGTTYTLHGISFTDENNGWAIGDSGVILHTANGGIDWVAQSSGTTYNLYGVSFTDINRGTVVGEHGTILKTTNAGTSWTQQSSGTIITLLGVSFVDINNGTAVGNYWNGTNYESIILNTTNGGTTWTEQLHGKEPDLKDVSFADVNNGLVVGGWRNVGGKIFRTTNAGATWNLVSIGEFHQLSGVSFTGVMTGTAVGGSDMFCESTILRTTDGGTTWTEQSSPVQDPLIAVSFSDTQNGTAVGSGGTILRTTNGGTEWTEQTSGVMEALYDVCFIDANNGWAVGFDYNLGFGVILHTTNGGVPVELTSFTATSNGNEVILNWSTATELNNLGFEIQRSIDEEEFITVGFKNGHGTTTEQHNYCYSDRNLDDGNYYYRLKQVDYDGSFDYSDVVEVDFKAFNSYLLEQNYPNPFNPATTIGFGLQNKSNVKITILNTIGEEVAVVMNEEKEAGHHQIEFNAINLPSGVYFYQLKAGDFIETKKMILMK